MLKSMFPNHIFAEMERLQREMQNAFEFGPSIRGAERGSFPAVNIGGTPQSTELYAFAPGLDPSTIEVNLERGVLTVSGERAADLPAATEKKTSVHINERFAGRFRRVISLPEDGLNPDGVTAEYRDGVLHVSLQRREVAQPRRISVQ